MRRVICLIISTILILSLFTGCTNQNDASVLDTLTFEKISMVNSRANLLKKYPCIMEITSNINTDTDSDFSWAMTYAKEDDHTNILIDMGSTYKAYYYNGKIYSVYDERVSPVLTFREKYDSIINTQLKRDNTLSTVYHTISSKEEVKEGYIVSFDFKATPALSNDLTDWNVKVGDDLRITYYLNKDLEIVQCIYYSLENNEIDKEMVKIYTNYEASLKIPSSIKKLANSTNLCQVNLYENYGMGSQYSESYLVPKDTTIEVNSNLYAYNIYTTPNKSKMWDFETDIVTKETNLYLYQDLYMPEENEKTQSASEE